MLENSIWPLLIRRRARISNAEMAGFTANKPSGLPPQRTVGRPRVLDSGHASLVLVLNLIRQGIATTRQDIERCAELGRAVVADRLAVLGALKLVEDGELGPSGGGRAPRHVRFRRGAAHVLVSALDRASLSVGIADLSGTLLSEHHEALDPGASAAEVLERVIVLFNWLLEDQPEPLEVWAIGLSAPGPIDPSNGTPFPAPRLRAIPAWADFPYVEKLAAAFGAPVWTQGTVQVMTMGELKAGAGRGLSDILLVELGRTISAGLVSNGRLHVGAHGSAGLIGQSFVENSTLDALAGSDALATEAAAAARDGRSNYLADLPFRDEIAPAEIGHGAELGDAFCVELLTRTGRLIGEALAPLVNLTNPAAIVLAGAVAQSGDTLLAAVREAVYRQSNPLVTRDLQIVRSDMGSSAGLVGAAQFAVESLFDPAILAGWITLGSPRLHPQFLEFLAGARRPAISQRARPEPPRRRRESQS
jgi:predicted NBD/HSP70 family sugar kinase